MARLYTDGAFLRRLEQQFEGDHDNHALAVELARLPLDIRGFGDMLEAN